MIKQYTLEDIEKADIPIHTINGKLSFSKSRIREILKMRLEGKTLQEIGNHFGRQRERIRQLEALGEECIRQSQKANG